MVSRQREWYYGNTTVLFRYFRINLGVLLRSKSKYRNLCFTLNYNNGDYSNFNVKKGTRGKL